MDEIIRKLTELERRLDLLSDAPSLHYQGAQAGDFSTTTLPHHGDFGYQTTDNEVQMNCNGTIRAISTAAL